MSNMRKVREVNGGRLTRPRSQWAGKRRLNAAQVQAQHERLNELAAMRSSLAATVARKFPARPAMAFPRVSLPQRKGNA